MFKSYLALGASVQGTVSGLMSFSQSQGDVWLPLVVAMLGVLPWALSWANACIESGDSASA